MLRNCKNPKCNKEFTAKGRQAFCSDKCRMAFNYLKKTGKVESVIPARVPTKKEVAGKDGARELMGLVVKVTTVPSEKKQIHIEVDLFESSGISDFLKKPAKIIFYDEIEEEKEEPDPYMD